MKFKNDLTTESRTIYARGVADHSRRNGRYITVGSRRYVLFFLLLLLLYRRRHDVSRVMKCNYYFLYGDDDAKDERV